MSNTIVRIPFLQSKYNRLPVCYEIDGVLNYGESNAYPERANFLRQESGVLNACINKYADFIKGRGFQDPILAKSKANSKCTYNNLLGLVAKDKSFLNTVAIHVTYNQIGRITELTYIPARYVRIRKNGDYAIWNNWLRNNTLVADTKPIYIRKFDPENITYEIQEDGGIENNFGQLFFENWTSDSIYSLSTFDSVINDVIADIEYSSYRKNSVQNGFSAGGFVKYNGYVQSDEERQAIANNIKNMQGSDEAGNIVVLFPSVGEVEGSMPLSFTPITPINNDKLFELQGNQVISRIVGAYNQPRAMHTFFDDSGIYNQDLLNSAWGYYNEQTRNAREEVKEIFERFAPYMPQGFSNFNIIPQKIEAWYN